MSFNQDIKFTAKTAGSYLFFITFTLTNVLPFFLGIQNNGQLQYLPKLNIAYTLFDGVTRASRLALKLSSNQKTKLSLPNFTGPLLQTLTLKHDIG